MPRPGRMGVVCALCCYHSLEATLDKQFSRGLSFHAAYTYSHSIDWVVDNLFNGGSASIEPNAYNVEGPRGGLIDTYADCLGNGALSGSAQSYLHWFNTDDYALPPGRLGTCGRNTLYGPGLVQFDFNLTRSFNYFGEGRRLEARWD